MYVYLIYGMYWMLNIVTGEKGTTLQAVPYLNGLGLWKGQVEWEVAENGQEFYGEDLTTSNRIWLEDNDECVNFVTRVGVDYAGEWKINCGGSKRWNDHV